MMILALVLAAKAAAGDPGEPGEHPRHPPKVRVAPPDRVYVGAYLNDVSDFDLKAGRFKADVRVWVKWLGPETPPPLEFLNAEIDSKEELGTESDGRWHSTQWRLQGTFRGDFPVQDFPFDQQRLPIVFGLRRSAGELVPDLAASGMRPSFSITGWIYEPHFGARVEELRYQSDLGSVSQEGQDAVLRSVSFQVELARPLPPYVIKFVLPLSIILGMAILALFLPISRIDVRSGIGVTALLSCIAFHFTQADRLPDVSYLVAADKLFLGAYVLVGSTLVTSVLVSNLESRSPRAAVWLDRLAYLLLPLVAFVGVTRVLHREAAPLPPQVQPAAPAPPGSVLRLGVASLPSASGAGLGSLVRRPLVSTADGGLGSTALVAAPSLTNDRVQLLPSGGMAVRWELATGLAWSDGAKVTADDLRESFAAIDDPARTALRAADPHTLEAEYEDRRSEVLAPPMIYPAAFVRDHADAGREGLGRVALERGAPSLGPYRFESVAPETRAVLRRNPHFVGTAPAFETVEVIAYDGGVALAEALLRGEVDVVPSLPQAGAERLGRDAGVAFARLAGDLFFMLQPDLTVKPFDDERVRHAILQGLDRRALVDALEPLDVQVAHGLSPDLPRAELDAYEPEEARRTLKALGATKVPVKLIHVKSREGTPTATVVVRLTAMLEALGFKVIDDERADVQALVAQRGHGGLLLTARDPEQPLRFFNLPFAKGRFETRADVPGAWEKPERELYERYEDTLYEERRRALLERLQEHWARRLPVVPLVVVGRLAAARRDLQGFGFGTGNSVLSTVERWRLPDAGVR